MELIEQIKAEIERLQAKTSIGLNEYDMGYENGKVEVCGLLLSFINSLPQEEVGEDLEETLPGTEQYAEQIAGRDYVPVDWVETLDEYGKWKIVQAEPVSEDLEKELNNQMDSIYPLPEEDDFDDPCYSESNAIKSQRNGFKKGFEVGANWQKEQMMVKAIDGEVGYWTIRGLFVNMEMPSELEEGDKVKLVIVKED